MAGTCQRSVAGSPPKTWTCTSLHSRVCYNTVRRSEMSAWPRRNGRRMASKSVPASGEAEILIQGFRAGPTTPTPYVFLGFVADDGTLGGFELSVEHANILG